MVKKIYKIEDDIICIVGEGPASDVPCGTCFACCLISPFLSPEEVLSKKYPISLEKSEFGLDAMMYKDPVTGACSMLKDNRCSIYDDRPMACRQFDCRKGHHPSTNKIAQEKFGIKKPFEIFH